MANSLGPGKLTLGETGTLRQFAKDTLSTFIDPSYSDGSAVDFLDGSEDREADEESWVLSGTVRQGLDADAVEDWCLEHKGTTQPFVFEPVNGGKKYTGTVRVRAIKIGGDVKKKNTSDFSFPMIGEPTLTAAP